MKKYQRRTAEQWQSLLNQQRQSGLSAPLFCKEFDITYASFCQWRKRLTEAVSGAVAENPDFIELATAPISSPPLGQQWAIELDIGGGMFLRIAKN